MKSGLIMMIIDLIAFIKALIDLGWDFDCDEEGKEEQIINLLGELEDNTDYTIETVIGALSSNEKELIGRDKIVGGIVSRTPIFSCTLDAEADRVLDWDNHFDVIMEHNDLRAMKWGV